MKSKITRFETALLGQEQSEARACLEEALKKAKTEGSEFRDTPPEVSLAECKNSSARGFIGSPVAERRVLEDALAKVRARATVAPVGQRLDECEKYCERAAKRLEKAKETVGEALKVQTQQEEELAEGKRRLEVLRAEAAAQPVPQPTIHRLATEKISTEISFKEQIDLLMQEVAALKVRVPVSGSGGAETALVPVSRGSALMSDLIEEADKKRPRVTEGGSGPCAS